MTDREKELIKYQKQYLNLVNKITQLQLSGENLPKELLKQAQEVGPGKHLASQQISFSKRVLSKVRLSSTWLPV